MEETLTAKMKELMTVLDQVKKYRALLNAIPDFIIILAISLIVTLAANVVQQLSMVYISYINPVYFGTTVTLISLTVGLIAAVIWVNQRIKKAKVGQWQNTLNEGAPGALKLLQGLDWDAVFSEVRYAKLGFTLYSILRTAGYWLLTFVASYIAAAFIGPIAHVTIDIAVIALFALVLVVVLSQKSIKEKYDQIGRLDNLLWELRWMDNDFRRNPFQT